VPALTVVRPVTVTAAPLASKVPLPELIKVPATVRPLVACAPLVVKVEGEFWLLYSAVIQLAERAVEEILTSSIRPWNGHVELGGICPMPKAEELLILTDAAVGFPGAPTALPFA